MPSFDFAPRLRIVCGAGKLEMLGELALELGAKRVLVVSDPGIIAVGHSQRGIDVLTKAGLTATLFGQIEENPSTRHVAAGLAMAQEFQPDLLVGLGGGVRWTARRESIFSIPTAVRLRTIGASAKPPSRCFR